MTKKRTTIYLDEKSQNIIDNIQLNLDLTQTDVIKNALKEYYMSKQYEQDKDLTRILKEKRYEYELNKLSK